MNVGAEPDVIGEVPAVVVWVVVCVVVCGPLVGTRATIAIAAMPSAAAISGVLQFMESPFLCARQIICPRPSFTNHPCKVCALELARRIGSVRRRLIARPRWVILKS